MSWLAAACVLLSATEPELGNDEFIWLQRPLRALASDWELLDPQEASYYLSKSAEFETDIFVIRRRCRDLAAAPGSDDWQRFPPPEIVKGMLAFSRGFQCHWESQRSLDERRFMVEEEVARHERWCLTAWEALHEAQAANYSPLRRQALRRLRDDILGPEAYYQGRMPPPVPYWYFAEIP